MTTVAQAITLGMHDNKDRDLKRECAINQYWLRLIRAEHARGKS